MAWTAKFSHFHLELNAVIAFEYIYIIWQNITEFIFLLGVVLGIDVDIVVVVA